MDKKVSTHKNKKKTRLKRLLVYDRDKYSNETLHMKLSFSNATQLLKCSSQLTLLSNAWQCSTIFGNTQ